MAFPGLIGVGAGWPAVVAVGLRGVIVTSPDGVEWNIQPSAAPANLIDAAWGGGQWVAIGLEGTILTSPDGIGWQPQNSNTRDALQAIAWSDSLRLFVVADASTPNVLTSPDGFTWTIQPLGIPNALLGIDWDGQQFIGVGYNGTIVTSSGSIMVLRIRKNRMPRPR